MINLKMSLSFVCTVLTRKHKLYIIKCEIMKKSKNRDKFDFRNVKNDKIQNHSDDLQ